MFTNMLCICSFSSSALPETQHQAVYDEQKNGSSQAESLEEIEASDWWGTSAWTLQTVPLGLCGHHYVN